MITTLLIIGATVITLVASVIDYRKYSSLFRLLLILISGLLLAGFLLTSQHLNGDSGIIHLLTDGVRESDLPLDAGSRIISLESSVRTVSEDTEWLSTVEILTDIVEPGRTIEIHGYGIEQPLPNDFKWIDRLHQPRNGLLIEDAPQQINVGKEFQLTGRLIAVDVPDSVFLYRDGARIESSATENDGTFTFSDRLWVEGPVQYHIEAQFADTLLREPWHVRGTEPAPLSIAVMLYSPSFEITHLAEWLGNNGHNLAMRTRVGKDRFRLDEINDPPSSADGLLNELSKFDLLILDPRELAELPSGQIETIQNTTENGLDVLMLSPSENGESLWERSMESVSGRQVDLTPVARIEERQWMPDVAVNESALNSRLPILNFNFEEIAEGSEPLGAFEESVPVSIRLPAGQGSVSSHLFYQSYRWKLRGDEDLYTEFWSDYLDGIVTLEAPFAEIGSMVPKISERVMLTTSGRDLTVRSPSQGQDLSIPMVAGADHPGVNVGYFWPESAGWHVAESGETSRWFFVYDTDWSFKDAYYRYTQTKQEIAVDSVDAVGDDQSDGTRLPNWVWLIGFLFLQVILWTERKLVG